MDRKGFTDLIREAKAKGDKTEPQKALDEAKTIADRIVSFNDVASKSKRITMILISYQYRISTILISYHHQSRIISGSYQEQSSIISYSYSSSSYIDKTTTKGNIESILSSNPELGYWRNKGLTEKQIDQWMKTAKCSLENMIQYLCYCRFEMVDLNLEESKPVENVFNWFFKMLERTGSYPKPKGYKSHQEKQIEQKKRLSSSGKRKFGS